MKNSVKYLLATVSLCTALATANPVYAAAPATNSDMQILKDKLKADKKLLVATNLALTDAEAKGFWPVYDAYQKDLGVINKRIGAAIEQYANAYNAGVVADDVAGKLINESVAIEGSEAQMRKDYAAKVLKVLPAAKGARYLQIESKIRALIRYELAAAIPLVE